MEEEKKALDELIFIKKIMQDSQKIVVDNGMGYIVWGILVTIGMLGGYVKYKFDIKVDYMLVWVVIITVGWLYSYYKFYRHKRTKIENFAGKLMGALWFSVGISNTIIGFWGYYSGAIAAASIAPIISLILGSAYFLTAVLHEKTWFKGVAWLWWAGGVIMFYFNGIEMFLIMAGLMLFGQVIPGIILYSEYKKTDVS